MLTYIKSVPRYRLQTRFHGHHDAITTMAVSIEGILASGGKLSEFSEFCQLTITPGHDGVKLWVVPNGARLEMPAQIPGLHGPTSSMIWLDFQAQPQSRILVFGTGNGTIVVWHNGAEVSKYRLELNYSF